MNNLEDWGWFAGLFQFSNLLHFGRFLEKVTLVIFENFEIALVLLAQFQNFQKYTRAIYLKSPSQTCEY